MLEEAASYRAPKTEIRVSPTAGQGLFAKEALQKGELVSVRGGHIITRDMEQKMEKPQGYWGYPISDTLLLAPFTAAEVTRVMMFLNHSCEPNVGILGQILFIAMRDIAPDEELTIDYAMFGGEETSMTCNCQKPSCRTLITNTDWQLEALQQKYKGYFSSYIESKIKQKHLIA